MIYQNGLLAGQYHEPHGRPEYSTFQQLHYCPEDPGDAGGSSSFANRGGWGSLPWLFRAQGGWLDSEEVAILLHTLQTEAPPLSSGCPTEGDIECYCQSARACASSTLPLEWGTDPNAS
jgi:hypothetical protein